MPITAITVSDITDFAGGHEFGTVGAYLRIRGIAHGVLDPDAPKRWHHRSRQGAAQRRRTVDMPSTSNAAAEEHATRQRHPGLRCAEPRLEADLHAA